MSFENKWYDNLKQDTSLSEILMSLRKPTRSLGNKESEPCTILEGYWKTTYVKVTEETENAQIEVREYFHE